MEAGGRDLQVPALLEFERAHPGNSGRKAELVRLEFGVTLARWYQRLAVALRSREALEHDALHTRQLLERSARRLARRAALTGMGRSRSWPTS